MAALPQRQRSSTSRTGRVLVVAEDSRIVLAIVRSLGRRKLEVDVAWCPPHAVALRSRYVSAVHDLPYDGLSNADRVAAVLELIDREPYDLVLPATESSAVAFDCERRVWNDRRNIYLLNAPAFAIACDKEKTDQLARSLGIAVPATVGVSNGEQLRTAIESLQGEAVLKPLRSTARDNGSHKRYVRRVTGIDEALRYAPLQSAPPWRLLVQEVVAGPGVGVEVLADQGTLLAAFQHKRIHETSGHGSTLRESVPLDPSLVESVAKLARAMDFTGVGMFEFRFQPRTGKFVLIEINGRFWGSLELAVAAGADFPRYLYEWFVEGETRFPPDYQVGILSRDLYRDLRWMYRAARGIRPGLDDQDDEAGGWDIDPVSRLQWLRDAASVCSFGHQIDSFAWDDPQPAIYELTGLGMTAMAHLWPADTEPQANQT